MTEQAERASSQRNERNHCRGGAAAAALQSQQCRGPQIREDWIKTSELEARRDQPPICYSRVRHHSKVTWRKNASPNTQRFLRVNKNTWWKKMTKPNHLEVIWTHQQQYVWERRRFKGWFEEHMVAHPTGRRQTGAEPDAAMQHNAALHCATSPCRWHIAASLGFNRCYKVKEFWKVDKRKSQKCGFNLEYFRYLQTI